MRKTFFVGMTLLISHLAFSQGGIQFQVGIVDAKNSDINITPEGMTHPGYFFGADASLNNGKMYFVTGLQLHKIDFLAQSEKSYFSVDQSMNIMKLRVGLGFDLFQITDKIKIKSKAIGVINIINSYPSNLLDEPYDSFNPGTAGVVFSAGIEFFKLSLEAEYEKGLINAVNDVEGTNFDMLAIILGWRL